MTLANNINHSAISAKQLKCAHNFVFLTDFASYFTCVKKCFNAVEKKVYMSLPFYEKMTATRSN